MNNDFNNLGEDEHDAAITVLEQELAQIRSRRRLEQFNLERVSASLVFTLRDVARALGESNENLDAAAFWESVRFSEAEEHEANLACTFRKYSNELSKIGRAEDALKAIEECHTIQRSVHKAKPAKYEEQLASVLIDYSDILSTAGQDQNSLKASEEAVQMEKDDAVTAAEEGVAIYRAICKHQASAVDERSAKTFMSNLDRLEYDNQIEYQLKASEESVTILRSLHNDADLALGLIEYSRWLYAIGREQQTAQAVEEALKLYQSLHKAQPQAFEKDVAGTLLTYSDALFLAGRPVEATAAADQAYEAYRSLHAAHPENCGYNYKSMLDVARKTSGLLHQLIEWYEAPAAYRPDAR